MGRRRAFAVLVAGGLRTFVLQAFFVPSGSMLPTLQIGDRIVVIKFGYTIHRGDIVVFDGPRKMRHHGRRPGEASHRPSRRDDLVRRDGAHQRQAAQRAVVATS